MRDQTAAAAARKKQRKSPTAKPTKPAKVIPLHDDVQGRIDTWTTNRKPIVDVWTVIAPTVRELVSAARPGGVELASKYMRVMARHVAARHMAGHRIDNLTELFSDKALASTFGNASQSDLADRSRATELSFMRRMRATLLPDEYGKRGDLVVKAASAAAPYTPEELGALLHWCRTARQKRTPHIHVALLLGVAAGLDGHETPSVTAADILVTPWGLIVQAPGMRGKGARGPRIVPVLADYEEELAKLVINAGDQPLLGESDMTSYDNLVSRPLANAGIPPLSGGRARSTWTRTLLERGASFVALRQAGIAVNAAKTLGELSAGLTLPMDAYVTMLRSSSTPFDPAKFAALTTWQVS